MQKLTKGYKIQGHSESNIKHVGKNTILQEKIAKKRCIYYFSTKAPITSKRL